MQYITDLTKWSTILHAIIKYNKSERKYHTHIHELSLALIHDLELTQPLHWAYQHIFYMKFILIIK